MDLSKYKHHSSFSSVIKVVPATEENKTLAKASLDNLKQYFPVDTNIDENPDLLYIGLAGYNGGIINKNGDGVTKETAISIAKYFKNKYIDKEHDRTKIVGNLLGYGFVKHGETESITEEEALAYDGPIDVILAGYVWRTVDEELSNLIEQSSDENSPKYGEISASWEVYYSEYDIVLGSTNISQAKIISDPIEVEKYSKFLKSNGGRGVSDDNQEVHKLIKGECLPVGLGLVARPAGIVKGVSILEEKPIVVKAEELENLEVKAEEINVVIDEEIQLQLAAANLNKENGKYFDALSKELIIAGIDEFDIEGIAKYCKDRKNKQKELILIEKNKKSVNDIVTKKSDANLSNKIKTKNMKLKFKDITKETLETLAATDVYEVAVELDKKMTEYATQLDSQKDEALAAKEEFEKVKSNHDSLAAELEKVKAELNKINEVRAAEKIQNDFNVRMADLNEKFELDAVKSKSIANQIRGLDDTSFAAWLESFQPFLVAKFVPFEKKDDKMEEDEPDNDGDDEVEKERKAKAKKECKASLLEEIQNLQPETKPIVNKVTSNKSIDELIAEAFKGVGEDEK